LLTPKKVITIITFIITVIIVITTNMSSCLVAVSLSLQSLAVRGLELAAGG